MKCRIVTGVLAVVLSIAVLGGASQASITGYLPNNHGGWQQAFTINDKGPDNESFGPGSSWNVKITEAGTGQSITETCYVNKDCSFTFKDGVTWDITCDKYGHAVCKDDDKSTPEPATLVIWSSLSGLAIGLALWRGRKVA